MLAYNKIDRVEGGHARHEGADAAQAAELGQAIREKVWLSARDGDGLDLLRRALGARLGLRRVAGELVLPGDAGRLRARLHDLGAVRSEQHDDDGWRLQLDLAEADASRLAAQDFGAPLRPLLDGTSAGGPSVEGGP